MSHALRVAVVIASTRPGRFGPTVARWFMTTAAGRDDVELDLVDLADADLPAAWTHRLGTAPAAFVSRIERAEAVVVVTPEYNHSFPASLKQAIDISGPAWARKPVGFVSYGGLSGGLRAVEALRPVLAEVRATTVRETVSFHQLPFHDDGTPHDPVNAELAAHAMLDDLMWWGRALRDARRRDVAWREAGEVA